VIETATNRLAAFSGSSSRKTLAKLLGTIIKLSSVLRKLEETWVEPPVKKQVPRR